VKVKLFSNIRTHVLQAVDTLGIQGDLPLAAITVKPPKDASHGHASSNAAMVLAKAAKQKPRDVAEAIKAKLEDWDALEAIEIAGPGFINFRFKPAFWQDVIPAIEQAQLAYGDSAIGQGQKVNVEYVSANPTGPLHIGHARGAVFGDALASLLAKAGYDVTKEYYINDAGAQVEVLAKSAHLRYREACGETIAIPEGLYPGDYLVPVGAALKAEFGEGLAADDARIQPFAINAMMDLIRTDLKDLGVEHDLFTSEKALQEDGAIERAIGVLRDKDLIYRGVLAPPKGKTPDDWEAREQLLFKSEQFGDDVDRALQKSDESYTYFAGDLALSQDKISRGFDELIYIFGADHGGYKKRMESSIKALSDGRVGCTIKLCQLVHLMRAGEPVKMSKRAGNFETVRDVLDAVGKDILRFVMLTRKNDVDMEFDLEKVKEQSKDNPVFYVQYAHARACSLQRLAVQEMPDAVAIAAPDYGLLAHAAEMRVILELANFPRIVEAAARAAEPHRIAYFLHELAASFHGLWHVGSRDADLRIVVPDNPDLTAARLGLAKAVAVVIACGLNVLGVEPKEEL
jgi:arginyl-tRNA synthetase